MRERARAMKGKRAGRARQECSFLCFSLRGRGDRLSFPSSIPFVYLSFFPCLAAYGGRGEGRPTRIDRFDLGQDMII